MAAAGLQTPGQPLEPGVQVSSPNLSKSFWLDIGISKVTENLVKLGDIGRSNLAFAGTEDLGGGLRAIFRLSTRFDIDTGQIENATAGAAVAKPFFEDESTVGLKGSFGTVRLGRVLTPLWAEAWKFDPRYNFDR